MKSVKLNILFCSVQGITKPAIRRLARRGGVKRISGEYGVVILAAVNTVVFLEFRPTNTRLPTWFWLLLPEMTKCLPVQNFG